MIILDTILAKKYALAFLNVYKNEIMREDLNKIELLEQFLCDHKRFYLSLGLSSIPKKEKIEVIKKLISHFGLKKNIENLFLLLFKQNRIYFFDQILNQIRSCYKVNNNIKEFKVFTSQDILEKEKLSIKTFIKSKIDMTELIAKFYKDPSLLVGIRFRDTNYLWERSIKKQLRNIYNRLIEEGC